MLSESHFSGSVMALMASILVIAVGACGDSVAPDRTLAVSITIASEFESPVLNVATRHDGVVVSIRSFGTSGCAESASPAVQVHEGLVVVTPLHYVLSGPWACPDRRRMFHDEVFIPTSMLTDMGIMVRGRMDQGDALVETFVDLGGVGADG